MCLQIRHLIDWTSIIPNDWYPDLPTQHTQLNWTLTLVYHMKLPPGMHDIRRSNDQAMLTNWAHATPQSEELLVRLFARFYNNASLSSSVSLFWSIKTWAFPAAHHFHVSTSMCDPIRSWFWHISSNGFSQPDLLPSTIPRTTCTTCRASLDITITLAESVSYNSAYKASQWTSCHLCAVSSQYSCVFADTAAKDPIE